MFKTVIRGSFLGVGATLLTLLTGCAQIKLAEPGATVDNVQLARALGTAPLAVDQFELAPGLPRALDHSVSIRGNSLFSPYDSSYARYLQETLRAELRGAGLLDPQSRVVVSGKLTQSAVEAGASQGTASLGARFEVHRGGKRVYDKELVENDSWPSSFVGAIAIPEAINRYTALYQRLVGRLFADEAFKQAIKF